MNRKFSMLLLLFAAMIMFTGCPGESPVDNPDDPSNPETPVNVVMQNVALTGLVKDASGNPLSGVKVTTGTASATTGDDGTFTLTQAGTVDDRTVVKFEKSGYFPLTRSGDKQDEMYIEAMLYRKGNDSISLQTDFDAAKGKRLQFKDVTIDFPANCMAKADGSAYSGTVRVDVLYLNSANENTGLLMPGGDLLCLASDKSKKMMLTSGMINVVLTDNNGNPLKIKSKTDIPISFPAPPDVTAATVPLRTFDEARGIWKEEGSVTKQGNVYFGTVSHFTFYDFTVADLYDWYYHDIHAETLCGEPAVGAYVTGYFTPGVKNDVRFLLPRIGYFTNAQGNCRIAMPYEEDGDFYAYLKAFYADQMETAYIDLMDPPAEPFFTFTFNVECVTLKINVTACDEPKSGVQVQVQSSLPTPGISNNPAMGEFKSMTTDADGNCTTQVTKGSQVHVIATYNGKTQEDNFQIKENTNLHFAFDDGCSDVELPERLSLKFTVSGNTEYLTYDNYGKRTRIDKYIYSDNYVSYRIRIDDYLTCTCHNYPGSCSDTCWWTYAIDGCSVSFAQQYFDIRNYVPETLKSIAWTVGVQQDDVQMFFANSNEWFDNSPIWTRGPDEKVNGVMCRVYTHITGMETVYKWKSIAMRIIKNGEIITEVEGISEDVPASAFTETVGHPWIK